MAGEPHAVLRTVKPEALRVHPERVDAEYHGLSMTQADVASRLLVFGQVDLLPLAGLEAFAQDGFEKRVAVP